MASFQAASELHISAPVIFRLLCHFQDWSQLLHMAMHSWKFSQLGNGVMGILTISFTSSSFGVSALGSKATNILPHIVQAVLYVETNSIMPGKFASFMLQGDVFRKV